LLLARYSQPMQTRCARFARCILCDFDFCATEEIRIRIRIRRGELKTRAPSAVAGKEITAVDKIVVRAFGGAGPVRLGITPRRSLTGGDDGGVSPFVQGGVAVGKTDRTGAEMGHGRRVFPVKTVRRPKYH